MNKSEPGAHRRRHEKAEIEKAHEKALLYERQNRIAKELLEAVIRKTKGAMKNVLSQE
jgi:hypothetical protein